MSDVPTPNPSGNGWFLVLIVVLNTASEFLRRLMPPPRHHNHEDLSCEEIDKLLDGAHREDFGDEAQ